MEGVDSTSDQSPILKITLAFVASANGKITRGDNPDVHTWSSDEDWQHFVQLRDASDVVILDRKTYETVQPQPESGKLRVVFTTTPERFNAASVPGQLEFTNLSPTEVTKHLEGRGYRTALLAGGAHLSSAFLAAGLVHELHLSFEPILFGTGRPLLDESCPDLSLELIHIEQLNARGTLLAKYRVLEPLA